MSGRAGLRWRIALFGLLVVASVGAGLSFSRRGSPSRRAHATVHLFRPDGPRAADGEPAAPRTETPAVTREASTVSAERRSDGGIEAALGLVAAPYRADVLEVPSAVRLESARAAVDRFAARVAALDAQRRDAERAGTDTTAIDHTLAVVQRRLEIAEYAASRTRDEPSASRR